jgi:heme-degrading monooxygenase HmoA
MVPPHARERFLAEVRKTHEILRTLPGYRHDLVMEQPSEPGEYNIVTVVEWDSLASLENAKAAVRAGHRERNFNTQEMFAQLGVEADLPHYEEVELHPVA